MITIPVYSISLNLDNSAEFKGWKELEKGASGEPGGLENALNLFTFCSLVFVFFQMHCDIPATVNLSI